MFLSLSHTYRVLLKESLPSLRHHKLSAVQTCNQWQCLCTKKVRMPWISVGAAKCTQGVLPPEGASIKMLQQT